jgi:hypothetical protein
MHGKPERQEIDMSHRTSILQSLAARAYTGSGGIPHRADVLELKVVTAI